MTFVYVAIINFHDDNDIQSRVFSDEKDINPWIIQTVKERIFHPEEIDFRAVQNMTSWWESAETLDHLTMLVGDRKIDWQHSKQKIHRAVGVEQLYDSKDIPTTLNDLEKEGLIILCSDGSIISDDFQQAIGEGRYKLIREEIDSTDDLPAQSAIFVKSNSEPAVSPLLSPPTMIGRRVDSDALTEKLEEEEQEEEAKESQPTKKRKRTIEEEMAANDYKDE